MASIITYVEQSLVYSLIATITIEALIQVWKVRNPRTLFSLRLIILLVTVFATPFYWMIQSDRMAFLADNHLVLFNFRNWWNVHLWGRILFSHLLIAIGAVSGLIYFFQEFVPAVREHFHPTPSDIFISGFSRPRIIVTEELTALLTPEELETVIAHERIHIRKFDLVKGWVLFIMRSVMFFNPVILIEFRRLMNDSEKICDQLAIADHGNPYIYASAMIKVAKMRYRASFENDSRINAIKSRLESILNHDGNSSHDGTARVLMAVASVTTILFFVI